MLNLHVLSRLLPHRPSLIPSLAPSVHSHHTPSAPHWPHIDNLGHATPKPTHSFTPLLPPMVSHSFSLMVPFHPPSFPCSRTPSLSCSHTAPADLSTDCPKPLPSLTLSHSHARNDFTPLHTTPRRRWRRRRRYQKPILRRFTATITTLCKKSPEE